MIFTQEIQDLISPDLDLITKLAKVIENKLYDNGDRVRPDIALQTAAQSYKSLCLYYERLLSNLPDKPTPKTDVAVIIGVKNQYIFLDRAIYSLLIQTKPVEIIVVMNDKPLFPYIKNKYSRLGIRVEYEAQQSEAATKNTGLKLTNKEYVTFLNADDAFSKNTIELLYNYLIEHDLDYVTPHQRTLIENEIDTYISEINGADDIDYIKQNSTGSYWGVFTASLFKRSLFNGYEYKMDGTHSKYVDFDMGLRFLERNLKCQTLNTQCYLYSLHTHFSLNFENAMRFFHKTHQYLV